MATRYLFGPVSPFFANEHLHGARQTGNCQTFDLKDGPDLTIAPSDCWEAVCSRFPSGWQPDFIVLYLPYRTVPACLWSAPIPRVGLAGDWNLLWHSYRRQLPLCELVLTDTQGKEKLA